MPNWLRGTEPCEAERCQCEARLKKRRPPEKRFFSFGHRPNYLSPLFSDGQKDGDGLDAGPDGGQGGEAALKEVQGGEQEGRQRERVNISNDEQHGPTSQKLNEDDLKIFIFVSLIFVCFSGDNCWEDDEVDLGGFSFVPMMVFEIFDAYICTNDGF